MRLTILKASLLGGSCVPRHAALICPACKGGRIATLRVKVLSTRGESHDFEERVIDCPNCKGQGWLTPKTTPAKEN